jgi:two-component system, NtrC family, sensor kinase
MPLRLKVLLILVAVFLVNTAVVLWVQTKIIRPSFVSLEEEEAKKNMTRSIETLQREIYRIGRCCMDWSMWDDTYKFAQDNNEQFRKTSLVDSSFTSQKVDLLYVYNKKGKVVWGDMRDEATTEKIHVADLPPLQSDRLLKFIRHKTLNSEYSGVLITQRAPLLISSRPILTSDGNGPIVGTLIMGRFLDEDLLKTIEAQAQVKIDIRMLPPKEAATHQLIAPKGEQRSDAYKLSEVDKNNLLVSAAYPDIDGRSALLIKATTPKAITARGNATILFSLGSLLALSVVTLLVMHFALYKAIIGPLGEMAKYTIQIGNNSELSLRLPENRKDEIGKLAKQFNAMLDQLAEARAQMLEQSYYTGMSDLASGVLHNVRNALSPLAVHVENWRKVVAQFDDEHLSRAVDEIVAEPEDEKRRADLYRYLQLAMERIKSLKGDALASVEVVAKQTAHIEAMLQDQEQYSRMGRLLEDIELSKLIEESRGLAPSRAQEALELEIDKSVEDIGLVRASRVALLQVFANLFTNATEAGTAAGHKQTTVKVHATQEQKDGRELVNIAVADNGRGIDPEILTHIFERGFTTKKNARLSGLGLHWSANTMSAMEGALYAESEGLGKGACFHVILPGAVPQP